MSLLYVLLVQIELRDNEFVGNLNAKITQPSVIKDVAKRVYNLAEKW